MLYDEKLHNLFASQNMVRAIQSGRMRWAERVARMGMWKSRRLFVGNPAGKALARVALL